MGGRAGGGETDAGKVIVTKLVLWIPRMVFNSDGIDFVQNNHTKSRMGIS